MKTPIFGILLTTLLVTGCQTSEGLIKTDRSSDAKLAVLLQQVNGLDTDPSTQGNYAKLFKMHDYCLIEFHGIHQSGEAVEYWNFKGTTLFAAYTIVKPTTSGLVTEQRKDFDSQSEAVKRNFANLKKQFSVTNLAQCR